jgi:phosphatidylserine decarboxylase
LNRSEDGRHLATDDRFQFKPAVSLIGEHRMQEFKWPERPSQNAFPVARPGYPFIFACAFTTAVLALLELTIPALIALLATFFTVFFFRDPDRVVPNATGVLVSPADGRIVTVASQDESPYYDGPCRKVSVFMSVFNVHVNRAPCEATIRSTAYHPGKFIAANRDKASSDNERNALFLESPLGRKVTVVQIAGLVARRIICAVQEGDSLQRGQRFGMICFGSRVDLYLPPETELRVGVGDKVKAGISIVGILS